MTPIRVNAVQAQARSVPPVDLVGDGVEVLWESRRSACGVNQHRCDEASAAAHQVYKINKPLENPFSERWAFSTRSILILAAQLFDFEDQWSEASQ